MQTGAPNGPLLWFNKQSLNGKNGTHYGLSVSSNNQILPTPDRTQCVCVCVCVHESVCVFAFECVLRVCVCVCSIPLPDKACD